MAGGNLPNTKLDGLDLSPLLLGKESEFRARDAFYYYRGFELEAVRAGPWKLHLSRGQLYRLDTDIGEQIDLAASHPDQVKHLQGLAQAMKADLGLTGADAPGIRPLGRVKNPKPIATP
jgi:hypothetical protein